MSATILPFTGRPTTKPVQARSKAVASLADHFGEQWASRHLPLVLAALDLLQAEEPAFNERCRLIAIEPNAIDRICGQLMHLGSHMADVADALRMTALRIRQVAIQQQGQPA